MNMENTDVTPLNGSGESDKDCGYSNKDCGYSNEKVVKDHP